MAEKKAERKGDSFFGEKKRAKKVVKKKAPAKKPLVRKVIKPPKPKK